MKNGLPGVTGLSARWIRILLLLFPREFRLQFGADLLSAFADLREDALDGRTGPLPRLGLIPLTLRTSWQVVRAGLAERWDRTARRPRRQGPRRKWSMSASLISDLRSALKSNMRRPGLAILAILTLGLGVGAGTAIFTVVNGVLLRPLPYPDSEQIISIQVNSGMGSNPGFYDLSEPEFLDLESEVPSLSHVAGFSGAEVTLGDSVSARRIRVLETTASLFPLLGVRPLLGRTFSPEEDQPGAPLVAVLSYAMWQAEFGGDPGVVGKSMTISERPATIIGVMPRGFDFPDSGSDAYTQLQLDRENPWERNNHYLPTIARLTPGATLEQARTEVGVLAARSTADYPEYYPNAGYRARLTTFQEAMVGSARTPLYVLLAAVGFVLLTACVNVANLLLARGETRKREMAIRTAIGASRGQVIRHLLAESVLLAAGGGVVGLALATVSVELLLAVAPDGVPRLGEIRIDGVVLGFSLLSAAATGLLFGVLPSLQPGIERLQEVLKEGGGGRAPSGPRPRLRRLLVAAQTTLAVVLVTGSGLMLRSVANIYDVDKGFETENILTFRIHPSPGRYDTQEKKVAFYRQLLERINGLPGVSSAAAVYSLPMTGRNNNWSILIDGRPVANVGEAPADLVQRVTPEYFQTLGMTLVRGRLFTREDDARSPPVVVISEAMARKHWPGEDPLGKRMKVFLPNWPWMEVIGVVKDVRHRGPTQEPRPRWYVPYAQAYVSAYDSPLSNTIVVRSATDPSPLMGRIEEVIGETDGSVPVSNIRTMDQILKGAVGAQRFVLTLLSAFGALALILAVVGVYGMVSYAVSRRTREIGLRMALGAMRRNVLTQVLWEGLAVSLVGVGIGLAGSAALSRTFGSMVFGIAPTDPLTYGVVVLVLVGAAGGASLAPARRASRISPIEALREE